MRIVKLLFTSHILILILITSSAVQAGYSNEEKKAYDQLMVKIDLYQGGRDILKNVAKQFYAMTHDNPLNELAYIGYARAIYKYGYIRGDEYDAKLLEESKKIIDQALTINPNSCDANIYAGFIELYKHNFQIAKAYATSAEIIDPKSPRMHLLWTSIFDMENNSEKMIEYGEKAKQFAVNNGMRVKANHSIIRGHRKLNQDDKAEIFLKENIVLMPDSAWVHVNYASFLEKRKRADEAIEMANKSLEIMDFGMGHHILAKAYYRKGAILYWKEKRKEEGAEFFELALKEDSTLVNANYGLGSHLALVGKKERNVEKIFRSKILLETALKYNPKHKKANEFLEFVNDFIVWLKEHNYIENGLEHSTQL